MLVVPMQNNDKRACCLVPQKSGPVIRKVESQCRFASGPSGRLRLRVYPWTKRHHGQHHLSAEVSPLGRPLVSG